MSVNGSNFATRETAAANIEKWKPCLHYGHEHILISNFGRVKSAKTGTQYGFTYPGGKGTQPYVSMNPLKDAPKGCKFETVSLAKLVWESHNGIRLPKLTRMIHKNNDVSDNRLVNLDVPAAILRAVETTSIINLPVIHPVSTPTPPPAAPEAPAAVLSDRDRKAIARYERLIGEAREFILKDAVESISDFDALNLTDEDLIEVFEGMEAHQIARFALNLVQFARNAKE